MDDQVVRQDNMGYVEWLVAKKPSILMNFLKILCIVVAVVSFLLSMTSTIFLILAIVGLIGAYFTNLYSQIEYEYLYCERELSVDRIMNKSKRKNVGKFTVERMEILAPLNSYHLDEYKNKTYKNVDLSSGVAEQPEKRYVFYYDGRDRVVIEPNAEIVKDIKNIAPRKVFTD